ncbi:MAG: RIP metalloprotease RseP [Brevinematales bacterium]|jgi:regulator of sigma E protease
MDILVYIIAIPILGVLVFVHEFGHYIIAKLNGIGVDVFSIGFGKELIGFTYGETRYRLSIVPFGGYCKLRGEESKDRDDKTEKDARAWLNKPPLSRLSTSLAGPVFNYFFAVILMTCLLYFGYNATIMTGQVEVMESPSAPAMAAGLRSGDTVLSIDNKNIEKFDDILPAVMFNVNKKLEMSYLHNGVTNRTSVTPRFNTNSGAAFIGVSPLYYSCVGYVVSNSPAFKAGMRPGDRIRSVDNVRMDYYYQFQDYMQTKSSGAVLNIDIARAELKNPALTNNIRIKMSIPSGSAAGSLGIELDPSQSPRYMKKIKADGLIKSFIGGVNQSDDLIVLTFKGVQAMVTGKVDAGKSMAGPIRILQFTGTVATRAELWFLIWFMAYISIALGFANLLPIPGLDGGHALISIGEIVSGRNLPDKAREKIEIAGVICILLIMVFALQNDIINIFFRK